jgi:hypothetical protein
VNTAPDFPDLPALFAQMRRANDIDEQRPPRRRFAEIRELARQMTPAERQTTLDYVNRVQIGLDALTLGATFVEQGHLDAATRMFTIAVRHDADGAEEELRSVQRLQAAFAEPGVPDDTVLGPADLEQRPRDDAGVRGISAYTLDWADEQAQQITAEARANAAQIMREAEEEAAAVIANAKATAEAIRDDAQRAADEVKAPSGDKAYGWVFADNPGSVHFDVEPAPPRADLSLTTSDMKKRQPWMKKSLALLPIQPKDGTHCPALKIVQAGRVSQVVFPPLRERGPARTEPRQTPPPHSGRLILPYLPPNSGSDAPEPEEAGPWWCARTDDASRPLLIVSFNLRLLARRSPIDAENDEFILPLRLDDTCFEGRPTTWLYSDLSCTAPEAVLSLDDSDDREPGVITDLSSS